MNAGRIAERERPGGSFLQAIRSTPFLRSGVHGLAGSTLVALCLAEIVRFSRDLKSSYPMAFLIFVAACLLVAGLCEQHYAQRLRIMSKKDGMSSIFVRACGFNLASASLAISWYANSEVTPLWNGGVVCMGIIGTMTVFVTFVVDVYSHTIARGTITAFLTAIGVILIAPMLHAYFGHTDFVQLMEEYPVRESVHIVMVCSTLVNAWDAFVIGPATSGRISYSTWHAASVFDWAVIFSTLVFVFLWLLWGIGMGVASFLFFFGCYAVSTPFERLLLGTGKSPFMYKGESNLDYYYIIGASLLVVAVAVYFW